MLQQMRPVAVTSTRKPSAQGPQKGFWLLFKAFGPSQQNQQVGAGFTGELVREASGEVDKLKRVLPFLQL